MNNELLLLIKKHTATLIEQTKTKPQEALEYKVDKQMQTFSFSPPVNLVDEGNWLIGVTSFESTNSVFNISDDINAFSITIPLVIGKTNLLKKTIDELNKLWELRSQNGIELHVEQVWKNGQFYQKITLCLVLVLFKMKYLKN